MLFKRQKARSDHTFSLVVSFTICLCLGGLISAENYDIYIAAGQSNMDGRGFISELTGDLSGWKSSQEDAIIRYTSPPNFQSAWSTLEPGFANNAVPPRSSRFGPELSFGAAMAAQNAHEIAIIKVTRGGTSLGASWSPQGGDMYLALVDAIDSALQQLQNQGDTGQIRGMIWHQGESDDVPSLRPDYEVNLTNFINTVRNDVLGMPSLPFVVGELLQEYYPGQFAEIRQAQFNVTQTLENVGFANSVGLQTTDGLHFNTPGVIAIGQRFASSIQAMQIPEPEIPVLLILWCSIATSVLQRARM